MDQNKIGKFIKKLRKDNHLTQKELAEKYNVTYQAVSKWENGINLPEVSLIRQMSKDFNISIDDILDGEVGIKKKNNKLILIILSTILVIGIVIFIIYKNNNNSFEFRKLSTTCNDFVIEGSIAYDNNSSSIYISNINYCGNKNDIVYKSIDCKLYEKNNNANVLISTCKEEGVNETLKQYLDETKISIDKYSKTCKAYTDDSLYLEISAKDNDNIVTMYKIPLKLKNNCEN